MIVKDKSKMIGALLILVFSNFICAVIVVVCLIQFPDIYNSLKWRLGLKGSEFSLYYRELTGHLSRLDRNMVKDSVIFIGDSHIQGLDVREIHQDAINFGIGGDTTLRVLKRITTYNSVLQGKAVVLLVGLNDFKFRDVAAARNIYRRIIESLPAHIPLYAVSIPPTGDKISNLKVFNMNYEIKNLCRERCIFIDIAPFLLTNAGTLDYTFFEEDRVHLNSKGANVLKNVIESVLTQTLG